MQAVIVLIRSNHIVDRKKQYPRRMETESTGRHGLCGKHITNYLKMIGRFMTNQWQQFQHKSGRKSAKGKQGS